MRKIHLNSIDTIFELHATARVRPSRCLVAFLYFIKLLIRHRRYPLLSQCHSLSMCPKFFIAYLQSAGRESERLWTSRTPSPFQYTYRTNTRYAERRRVTTYIRTNVSVPPGVRVVVAHSPSFSIFSNYCELVPAGLSLRSPFIYLLIDALWIVTVLLYYDFLLTLPDEVTHFWRPRKNLVKVLFLLLRYFSIFAHLPNTAKFLATWSAEVSVYGV